MPDRLHWVCLYPYSVCFGGGACSRYVAHILWQEWEIRFTLGVSIRQLANGDTCNHVICLFFHLEKRLVIFDRSSFYH